MNEQKEMSKSAIVIAKTMYAAMRIMKESGPMTYAELKNRIREDVGMHFTEWERSPSSEKSKLPRWELNMGFYAEDYSVAGFITRDSGVWSLTALGEKMLAQTAENVFAAARASFLIKRRENGKETALTDVPEVMEQNEQMKADDAESRAMEDIRNYIRKMSYEDFQNMVGALLRGLGYYTTFVATQGPDGGIDAMAFENPAGVGGRIIAQAKRFAMTPVSVDVVRNLVALLQKDTDTGIVFTSSRFTSEAVRFAQTNKHNIRLMELNEMVRLWFKVYEKLSDEDKQILPIRKVYFMK